MPNISELGLLIEQMHKTVNPTKTDLIEKYTRCLTVLELYARIERKTRTSGEEKACIYAATILSSAVNKNIATKTKKLLDEFEHKWPKRAGEILRANLMRMFVH